MSLSNDQPAKDPSRFKVWVDLLPNAITVLVKAITPLVLAGGVLWLFTWLLVNRYLPPTHYLTGLALCAVALIVLFGGERIREWLRVVDKARGRSSTPRSLAFFLLGAYTVALLLAGVGAMAYNGPDKNDWVDVYKSGFLLLGGGVTTAIGYFFSSRNQEETQKRTVDAIREFQGPDSNAVEEQPTTDETSLKDVK